MSSSKDRMIDWLRDAHAMERQAETMLSSLAGRLENYPEFKSRVSQHAENSKRQAERVATCLDRLGADPSAMKTAAGKVMATAQGLSGMFVGDEVMKGSLATYAFEHMEIGSYRMLAAAAAAVGDSETRQVCEQNLREEEEMAGWLDEHLAPLTEQYLSRDETPGVQAKH